jgi:serine/threonine protein kinase
VKIPGFDIVEKLGEGSVGSVWRAYQMSLNRVVAIKTLRPGLAAEEERFRHFIRQAQSAAKIKHPNVVQFLDIGEHEGAYYFVMEYMAGDTIARLVERNGPMAPAKALSVIRHVAEALESAWHMFNVAHHALKPQNLMLDEDGTVKVADLGLSILSNPAVLAAQIREGRLEVAPHYLSPEQAKCTVRQDCRSDIYSLGATLYFMVTGVVPFGEMDPVLVLHQHVDGRLPNPRIVNPSVSPSVAILIAKMTMKSPTDRYGDWGEVIHHVRKLESGGVFVQKPESYAGSTILPPTQTTTTSAAPAAAGPAAGPSVNAQAIRRKFSHAPRAPAWIRVPAWTALSVWLAFLAYSLLEPVDVLFSPDEPPAPPLPPTVERSAPPEPISTAPFSPEAVSRTATGVPRTPLPPEISADIRNDPAMAVAATPQLLSLRRGVADALCSGDFLRALRLVDDEMTKPQEANASKELSTLRDIIGVVSRMDKLVLSGARDHVDKELDLRIRNQPRRVTFRAAAGERINASTVIVDGPVTRTNSLTFVLSDIHPADRGKLLGPANTAAKCVLRFLFLIQGGEFQAARIFAENCGPLSEALMEQADAQRRFGA